MSAEEQNDHGYGRDLPGQQTPPQSSQPPQVPGPAPEQTPHQQPGRGPGHGAGEVPDQAGAPIRESLSGRVPGQAPAGQGGVTPEAFVAGGRDRSTSGDGVARAVVPAPADPVDGERPPSDAELTALVRAGDDGAYEEIYRRHADAVRRYARTCCRDSFTAEDLAGEVFARTLQALRSGKGPDFAVRAYLLTAVRNVATAWTRSERHEQLVDDFGAFAQTSPATVDLDLADPGADAWAMAMADQRMVMQAFVGLPEDDRVVLWHTEVERESPKTVAVMLGKTANATAVQAHRARDRLAVAFLQAHVSGSQTRDCETYASRLGAYARGSLRKRGAAEVGRHVQECDRCTAAYLELTEINTGLRAILPGGVLVWVGAGYFTAAAAAVGLGAAGTAAVAGGAAAGTGAAGTPGAAGAGGAAGTAGAGGTAGGGGAVGAAAGEGLGVVAKAGIAAGVAVAAAAVAAYALTDSPTPKEPKAAPAVSSPARPPAAPKPSPAPSGTPSAAPAPEPTPTPVPSRRAAEPTPRPSRAAVATPVPGPSVERSPSPQRTASPTPAPSVQPTTPPETPEPTPTPTPTVEPSPPPSTDFWVNDLPFGQGSDRLPSAGPSIQGSATDWVWQRDQVWIGGQRYWHGLSMHPFSTVTVDLNRGCSSFRAVAGLDDLTARFGEVVFSVQDRDGTTLWRSAEFAQGDDPVPVRVPLDGRRTIRLVVAPVHGGWGLLTLADWADARFSCG
ncbi:MULTISPECIES: sigma-70 family RNA polymerase sigma factor [Kitasatospora]|uniref:Glycosyl hydrolase family 98 putative carbohydrate-binding module domain-containing protein n=1 Tax=Kitasatospora cystarginea TaxID=58350 RepID=A0ABP5R188_9ACTN